jgi:hypothetical protein
VFAHPALADDRAAPFIIDALGPDALVTATGAGADLERRLRALDPAVTTARRLLTAPRA